MNKKGNFFMFIIFFVLLFLIIFLGVILAIGGAVMNWFADEALPELTGLGQVGGTNLTEIGEIVITPVDTLLQSTTWLTGVLYVLMIISSVIFAVAMKATPNKWLMGAYFAFGILLLLTSIFISNIYEDISTGSDELSIRLQEQTLLNFLILHSPMVFTAILFLTGIILFSGLQQEEFI